MVLMVKNLPANAGDKRCGFDPWVGNMPWRRAWQPTPVFLPGESHGQRSLAGYSPRGHIELDTPEHLNMHTPNKGMINFSLSFHGLSQILSMRAPRKISFRHICFSAQTLPLV